MLPLFISDVPLHCINEASIEFNIPATLIITILNIEQGKIGQAVQNKNGTYDLGPMQINSLWLLKFKQFGISKDDLQYNPCINVKAGTWLLAKSISSQKDFLYGIGSYHSHSFHNNLEYIKKTKITFTKIKKILSPDNFHGTSFATLPV